MQQSSVASEFSPHQSNNSERTSLVQRITQCLADRIGGHRYEMWFCNTRFDLEQDRLCVSTGNPFIAKWIDSHFADDIRTAATTALGREANVDIHVCANAATSNGDAGMRAPSGPSALAGNGRRTAARESDGSSPHAAHQHPRRRSGSRLRRVEDFVVSDTNRVAYGAAKQIAEAAPGAHHSPLFIHGPCGVGKTHLLQGACRHYTSVWNAAHCAIRYVTAEQFTNEYITAVRTGRIDEFRRRMRRLELLAIDDVHFLSNKSRTQVEFLHTYDEINMSGARVVLASDSHPRQLRQLNKALVNRLLSGMIVQIELPDLDLRRRLTERLAAARGLRLTEQAVNAIAGECTGSIRELEGAINKLLALRASIRQHQTGGSANGDAARNGSGETIGLGLVQQLLQDQTLRAATPVRISSVIDVTCRCLAVSRGELMGTGRHKRVVLARSLIAYLSREMTTHSFPEIADAIGRRNHSTVHNADRRLREQLDESAAVELDSSDGPIKLAELVNQLKQQIVRHQPD